MKLKALLSVPQSVPVAPSFERFCPQTRSRLSCFRLLALIFLTAGIDPCSVALAISLVPSSCGGAPNRSVGDCVKDERTGLHWLDWTMSTNRAFSDVNGQFGAGGDFEGFRYATFAELDLLLLGNGSELLIGDPPPLANDGLEALIHIMGETGALGETPNLHDAGFHLAVVFALGGACPAYPCAGDPPAVELLADDAGLILGPGRAYANPVTIIPAPVPMVGSALVVDSSAIVPEPSTMVMFVSGVLFALLRWPRRPDCR